MATVTSLSSVKPTRLQKSLGTYIGHRLHPTHLYKDSTRHICKIATFNVSRREDRAPVSSNLGRLKISREMQLCPLPRLTPLGYWKHIAQLCNAMPNSLLPLQSSFLLSVQRFFYPPLLEARWKTCLVCWHLFLKCLYLTPVGIF